MELPVKPITDRLYTVLCHTALSNDVQCECTLPDYLPDVRRVLRVTAVPRTAGRYMNGERLELEGVITLTLLYMADDKSVRAYRCDTPFTQNIPIAGLDENTVVTLKVTGEHASCRLSGPRKCTLRCKLHTVTRALTEVRITPEYIPPVTEHGTLSTKTAQYPAVSVLCATADDLRYAEDIPLTEGMLDEVLSADVTPCVSDTRTGEGSVLCKGEFIIEALCTVRKDPLSDEKPEPFKLLRRIPFEETLPCPGCTSAHRPEPDLCITSVIPTITEEGKNLGIDFSAELSVQAMGDTVVSVITDAFLPDTDIRITRKDIPSFLAYRTVNGTAVAHGEIRVDGGEVITAVTDTVMCASFDRSVLSAGKLHLSGDLDVHIIAKTEDGSQFPVSGTLPVTFECDVNLPDDTSLLISSDCTVSSASVRIVPAEKKDGASPSLACNADLAVFVSVAVRETISIAQSIAVLPDATPIPPSPYSVVFCYPSVGETIWDIAHRYRIAPEKICLANHFPPDTETVPASALCLLIPTTDLFSCDSR